MHLPEHEELTFAIGDIHGCFEKLTSLLAACDQIRGLRSAQFVLVGDYIDRGPQSREVMDFLVGSEGKQDRPFVCLRGNHEEMLLRAADMERTDRDLMNWWGNGGEQTLDSYGIDDPADLPSEHLDWIRALPLTKIEHGRLSSMLDYGRTCRWRHSPSETCCGSGNPSCRRITTTGFSLSMVIRRSGPGHLICEPTG